MLCCSRASAPLALVVWLFAVPAQSQPPTQAPGNSEPKSVAAPDDQPVAPPPISVTVTAPEPRAEDKKREDEYRAREVAAQEDVRDFTRALTWLAVIQAGVTGFALLYTIRAANA